MTQLHELSRPFPAALVKKAPTGKYGSYVPHSTVTERLLSIVGPFDLRIVEILRGHDTGHIEGAIIELTVMIDDQRVTVQEAGDCEQPTNWKTDGARLKDAVSDGVKRCSMRVGLGLHLWSQGDYFLEKQLEKDDSPAGMNISFAELQKDGAE
jgi:hypothetical protein